MTEKTKKKPTAREALTEALILTKQARPKWKKGCPDDRVFFAADGRGAVAIIDYIGPGVSYYMEDSLLVGILKMELAAHNFPGLWIWEGRLRSSRSYYGEYDEELDGIVRPLHDDERQGWIEEETLWDRSLWCEP